jgi:hypothetical protein
VHARDVRARRCVLAESEPAQRPSFVGVVERLRDVAQSVLGEARTRADLRTNQQRFTTPHRQRHSRT